MSDSSPGERRDISPDGTHVRMSLARFLSVIVGLAIAVGTFSATYYTLREHAANQHIHLREDFELKHGAPVGDRDLKDSKEETAQMVDLVVKVRIDELAKTITAARVHR